VIRTALETTSPTHATLSIAVSDTGAGIAEDARERIFEPFIQADDTITGQYGGTGLGLSIAQRLAQLMGGTIGVESVEGEGSTFWFSIPLERAAEDALPAPSGDVGLREKRALVVDGNRTNFEIMESYMTHWGMRVEAARTGIEALAAIRRGVALGTPFDVVMLDSALADMDAVTLLGQTQADARLDRSGFILLPPVGEGAEAKSALPQGFAASLMKPVKQAPLQEALLVALRVAEERAARFQTALLDLPETLERTETMVLLVEDNVVNQKLAGHQLQRLGYAMHKVNNGREAVERLAHTTYGVVLMDCQMPGMDGYTATRLIRQAEAGSGRHIPIIAVTAHALDGDRERCLEAGMDDYVAKPVSMDTLRTVLVRYLPKDE
jgi:CheY-like chemotaxis protein